MNVKLVNKKLELRISELIQQNNEKPIKQKTSEITSDSGSTENMENMNKTCGK